VPFSLAGTFFQSGALTSHGIEIVLWLLISADVDLIRCRGRTGTTVARAVPHSQHEQLQYTHTNREGSELPSDTASQPQGILHVFPPLKKTKHPAQKTLK